MALNARFAPGATMDFVKALQRAACAARQLERALKMASASSGGGRSRAVTRRLRQQTLQVAAGLLYSGSYSASYPGTVDDAYKVPTNVMQISDALESLMADLELGEEHRADFLTLPLETLVRWMVAKKAVEDGEADFGVSWILDDEHVQAILAKAAAPAPDADGKPVTSAVTAVIAGFALTPDPPKRPLTPGGHGMTRAVTTETTGPAMRAVCGKSPVKREHADATMTPVQT